MTELKLACPECGGELVLREGKFGKFYGCRSYPSCTGKMNLKVAEAQSNVDVSTQTMRVKAGKELTALTQSRGWSNLQASRWMREIMGLNWDEAKVNLLSSKQCEILLAYIKMERNPSTESEIAMAMKKARQRASKKLQ